MNLRQFRESDAPDLAALTLAAIRKVGARRYSSAQIEVWAARHPGPGRFIDRHTAGDLILVSTDADDKAVAYALLERGGHLDMLYCHPDYTRRGLAEALLAEAERHARANGVMRLFTEASELARPAFERAGYSVVNRRDFEIDGVAIHNFAMEKHL